MEPPLHAPLPLAESRRTAVDLIRQTLRASKAPGRSVRVGSLLPRSAISGIAPQQPFQLLGRQPAPETSPHVHLGSLDERLTKTLVQAGAALRIGSGDVPLWIAHDDEGSATASQGR